MLENTDGVSETLRDVRVNIAVRVYIGGQVRTVHPADEFVSEAPDSDARVEELGEHHPRRDRTVHRHRLLHAEFVRNPFSFKTNVKHSHPSQRAQTKRKAPVHINHLVVFNAVTFALKIILLWS